MKISSASLQLSLIYVSLLLMVTIYCIIYPQCTLYQYKSVLTIYTILAHQVLSANLSKYSHVIRSPGHRSHHCSTVHSTDLPSQLIAVKIEEHQVKLQCLSCPSNPTYLEFPGHSREVLD